MKNIISLFFLASLILIVSCGKDDDTGGDDGGGTTCETTGLTYTNSIKAILDTNCATSGCHNEDGAATIGAMHDYATAKVFADFGRIGGAINHEDDFSPMPYPEGSDKLDACTIDKIEAWIADGAPE